MVALLIALAVAVLCGLAELLHALRCRRVAYLAFGQGPAPWWLVASAAVARTVACGALAWGLVTLLEIDVARWKPPGATQREDAPHHLVIALDVSPSMELADGGPTGKQTRAERARDVLNSIIDRLDAQSLRVSVVAFYSEARPVVVDTFDMNVVENILDDLPLTHAFEAGKTDLYAGIAAASEIGRRWRPGSATLVLVSDGDTLPADGLPRLPKAFAGKLILGVGNPRRGLFVHDHLSRQDAKSLRRLALHIGGIYNDTNHRHVPSSLLQSLDARLPVTGGETFSRRKAALWVIGLGAALLAVISPVLGLAALWLEVRRRKPLTRYNVGPAVGAAGGRL